MEALTLTSTKAVKSNQNLIYLKHEHDCACASAGVSVSSPSLKTTLPPPRRPRPRPLILQASLQAHPNTRSFNYLHHKQVEFFIRPLTTFPSPSPSPSPPHEEEDDEENEMIVAKLRLVAAAAADRAEMHAVLADQRDGWNKLFHSSLTNITLAALILQALLPNNNNTHFGSSIAATLLYGASTALMCGVNKIQPSQLAEEQRMAARLFRQLNTDIHTNLALPPHLRQERSAEAFLSRVYDAVLALDKAYPLPLFPGMLDKFPKIVEPAVWWPQQQQEEDTVEQDQLSQSQLGQYSNSNTKNIMINGWSAELERELKGVSETLRSGTGDIAEFVGLSQKVLQVNTILAIAGPLLTGTAGTLNIMNTSSSFLSMSMVAGVVGVVASTLSHGGQIGTVFEMYRNCAGLYHFLDSSISRTLKHSNPEMRENGELFRWKLALQLGRDPHSPLSDSSSKFAGKLF